MYLENSIPLLHPCITVMPQLKYCNKLFRVYKTRELCYLFFLFREPFKETLFKNVIRSHSFYHFLTYGRDDNVETSCIFFQVLASRNFLKTNHYKVKVIRINKELIQLSNRSESINLKVVCNKGSVYEN